MFALVLAETAPSTRVRPATMAIPRPATVATRPVIPNRDGPVPRRECPAPPPAATALRPEPSNAMTATPRPATAAIRLVTPSRDGPARVPPPLFASVTLFAVTEASNRARPATTEIRITATVAVPFAPSSLVLPASDPRAFATTVAAATALCREPSSATAALAATCRAAPSSLTEPPATTLEIPVSSASVRVQIRGALSILQERALWLSKVAVSAHWSKMPLMPMPS